MEVLSKCEEEVLLSIFRMSEEDAALQQIMEYSNKNFKHEWKPQTVSTFLTRLVKKGYLTMQRSGRYVYYFPVMSLEEYQKIQLQEMKQRLFYGDADQMLKGVLQNLFDGKVDLMQERFDIIKNELSKKVSAK